MDVKEAELKKVLDQLAVGYQTGLKEYQDKGRRMSAKQRQEAESKLMQQQQLLNQQQQQAQQELQKFGQDKMEEINEDIQDFVTDYAKSNGYTYILGNSEQTRAVMYGASTNDLTDELLEALNDQYKKGMKTTAESSKDSIK